MTTVALMLWLAAGGDGRSPQDRSVSAALYVEVMDGSGQGISGASVSIEGTSLHVSTDLQGRVDVPGLSPGRIRVQIGAPGFRRVDRAVALKHDTTRITVVLKPEFRDEVRVLARAPGSMGPRVLLPAQIAALPEDPDELARALEELAGPGAIVLVNGFRGGRLPPKSQILEIRLELDPFSARYHEGGRVHVEVVTKPGLDGWRADFGLGAQASAINARSALAPDRGPSGYLRLQGSLSGPLRRGSTSLAVSTAWKELDRSIPFRPVGSAGPVPSVVPSQRAQLDLTVRIEHRATDSQSLQAEYQISGTTQSNVGSGELVAPGRGSARDDTGQHFRLGMTGPIGQRVFNQFRLQVRRDWSQSTPNVAELAIDVPGYFYIGGDPVQWTRRGFEIGVSDDVDLSVGRHGLRMGMDVSISSLDATDTTNYLGTVTFSDPSAIDQGRPLLVTQRSGTPSVKASQSRLGWYIEDMLVFRKGQLSLSGGLRHEFQDTLQGWKNLSPRVFVTWSLPFDRATRIKAGVGVFHEWLDLDTYESIKRLGAAAQTDTIVQYGDAVGEGIRRSLRLSSVAVMPEITRFSLEGERHLSGGDVHLWLRVARATGRRLFRSVWNARKSEMAVESIGRSASSEVFFHGSVRKGSLVAVVNYWFVRNLNDGDDPLTPLTDGGDASRDWGSSLLDARHRVTGNLHFNPRRGMRFSAVWRLASGVPYDLTTGADGNGDGVLNDRPAGVRRNAARGAPQSEVDLSFSWTWRFGARVATESTGGTQVIRGDDSSAPMGLGDPGDRKVGFGVYLRASNAFNSTSRIAYIGVVGSPSFGQAVGARPARRLESGIAIGF